MQAWPALGVHSKDWLKDLAPDSSSEEAEMMSVTGRPPDAWKERTETLSFWEVAWHQEAGPAFCAHQTQTGWLKNQMKRMSKNSREGSGEEAC